MRPTPKTTITIPSYNAEHTLGAAVQSALDQTEGAFEVLVVDDGSRIPATEVLDHVDDPRVRIVRHDSNRGLSAARNTALAEVRTPYLSQLDADDIWEPNYLASVLPRFGNPAVGLVYTDARILHADGSTRPYLTSDYPHPIDRFPGLARRNPIAALTVTMRTDAVRAVGGYADWLWGGQDYFLYLELAAAGWRFDYVDEPLALYRAPDEHGAMSSDARKVLTNDLKLLTRFKLRHPGLPGPGRRIVWLAGQIALRYTPLASNALRRLRSLRREAGAGGAMSPSAASESGRKLRVVTLTDELGADGGAEALALEILCRLDPGRFERTYAVSRWPTGQPSEREEALAAGLEAQGIDVFRLRRTAVARFWQWLPLLRMLRERRVDVLHAHMFGSNVWGSILGRLARVPVVISHEHTWSYVGQPLRRLLDREVVARLSNVFVACSRDDQRKMIQIEGISPDRTIFIPNGIAFDAADPATDLRAELGILGAGPVIGTLSNLRPQKALTVFVDAIGELVKEFPDVRGLIAGSGGEEQTLRAHITAQGLSDHVLLLGTRGDTWDLLATLDVAVMSSDYEGSPLAVMEYMEAKLPIVATAVGGVPDLIEDGVHGLLVERRDPSALAAAISELVRDPERARAMGEAAQARRREEFDIDVMVRRVSGLYERLYSEAVR